jgi:hypothetical protein
MLLLVISAKETSKNQIAASGKRLRLSLGGFGFLGWLRVSDRLGIFEHFGFNHLVIAA